MLRDEHDWKRVTTAVDWERYECASCRESRYPSPIIGLLWRARLWLNRCPRLSSREQEAGA